jgi:hypothetical protein
MPAVSKTRYLTQAGWDDAAHLSAEQKKAMLADVEPHLRDARSKGDPSMGAGMIYPISPDEISYTPFQIPAFWPRVFAMDVGWNVTAALWGALDRSTDTLYIYSEYFGQKQLPLVHAAAIKARGAWIPGVIDPASRGRSQADGEQLLETYRGHGLNLTTADNSVESGLEMVWERKCTGRTKVATNLQNYWREHRQYRRHMQYNKHGALVAEVMKVDDHVMDTERYLTVSGVPKMRVQEFRRPDRGGYVVADSVAGV